MGMWVYVYGGIESRFWTCPERNYSINGLSDSVVLCHIRSLDTRHLSFFGKSKVTICEWTSFSQDKCLFHNSPKRSTARSFHFSVG